MKATETFDCIELKDRVQAELAEEYKGLAEDEKERQRIEKFRASNHPAARLWRRLTGEKT
ncbi:MAG TPA: hypothetical protein PLO37_23850 [Candidatus Hydrogenedentes bacterium]|nr:hypothetical protein [Candidatus Hydrogenedentota bacterium]